MAEKPRTLLEKIWDDHVVASEPGAPAILAIDLHLVHEVTSRRRSPACGSATQGPQAGPDRSHGRPFDPHARPVLPIVDELARKQLAQIEANCREFGIPFHGKGSPTRGIVHVIGPELGSRSRA